MKHRFDAGTDVAMIGAWDGARGAQPFSDEEYQHLSETLDADANAGHIFVLHTGADGGGPIDAYIDEPIPPDTLERLTPLGDTFVLALPSGMLMVDGAEYYRPKKPATARSTQVVNVPAGDYMLRCYGPKEDEAQEAPTEARSEQDLETLVGRDELRYYERVTRGGCLIGFLLLLLLPILWPIVGLKIAFAVTVVAVVGYFNVREWMLRRNARFTRLRETIGAFRRGHEPPTFVLELRPIQGRAGLTGGSV